MPSLKFPDTGTRMVLYRSGRPAAGAVGYLYADRELTTVAEAYTDVDGEKGALLPTDSQGRRYVTLDTYGEQPDYWGPAAGTDRLWISINGVVSPVDADYNARLDALAEVAGLLVSQFGEAGDDDLVMVQAAINAAASTGNWLIIDGEHPISGTLAVPTGARIDCTRGRLTQLAGATPTLLLDNATDVRIRHPRIAGFGADWVNNTTVYNASGIRMTGTTADVVIEGGELTNLAGAGIFAALGVTNFRVRHVTITGPGSPALTASTSQYGGNIVLFGCNNFDITGCDLSNGSQGIVTGEVNDFRIRGNRIHDVIGQHGMYLEPGKTFTISANTITRTGLQGIKAQIATTSWPDVADGTIVANTITSTGSHNILLTNTAGGSPRTRRVVVASNVLTGDGAGGGDGVNANNLAGVQIVGNNICDVRKGVNVSASSGVQVLDNYIDTCDEQGVNFDAVTKSRISRNTVINPAATNGASTEFGIELQNACASVTVDNNDVSDAAGNMKYGLYVVPGVDQASCAFRNNTFAGATDYGARLDSTVTVGEWRNNTCTGTLGSILSFPSTLVVRGGPTEATGTAAPTSGTWARGDIVWNRSVTAGGILGWVCTTAGTPGTWAAFGQSIAAWSSPVINGLLGGTFDPINANVNMPAMTAGTLYVARISIPVGGVISAVQLALGVAGSTLTSGQNLAGVYAGAAGGALLGQSADQSSSWTSTGQKAISLTAPTPSQDAGGFVYVALLWNGSVSPQLRGLAATASFVNINASALPRFATAGSSLTALPANLPTLVADTATPWVGLS